MILIALGANLAVPGFASPLQGCEAAVCALSRAEIRVVGQSPWYRTAPMPPSGQPDFINGVIRVETALSPHNLLCELHKVEREFGRVRTEPNAARTMDLDLLAYDDLVLNDPAGPIVPHPRLEQRLFVLRPMRDVAPDWRHPVTGRSVDAMIAALDDEQDVTRLA